MLLTLVLLRHGAAEDQASGPPGPRGRDHGRRLTSRGRAEAQAAAAHLKAKVLAPALVIASDAVRTRETAEVLTRVLPAPLEVRAELYLAEPHAHASVVGSVGDQIPVVILVGHNPGLSTWASHLSGDFVSLGTGESVILSIEAQDFGEAVELAGLWQLSPDTLPN